MKYEYFTVSSFHSSLNLCGPAFCSYSGCRPFHDASLESASGACLRFTHKNKQRLNFVKMDVHVVQIK